MLLQSQFPREAHCMLGEVQAVFLEVNIGRGVRESRIEQRDMMNCKVVATKKGLGQIHRER